jgi:ribosomal RNA-processing protein 7
MAPSMIAGFLALPITLRSSIASSPDAIHYLYLKPHEPKDADEDAPRSLFLVNIPITTTPQHLKHLFATQLSGGRVEDVHFSEDSAGRPGIAAGSSRSRKRKRLTAEEIEAGLDKHRLPQMSERDLHVSGSTAIVVFVDKPSMELSLKAARKAIKAGKEIVWSEGIEDQLFPLGLKRYQQANQLRYPSRRELLRCVDNYMTAFAQMEEARAQENAKKRQMPDEDGFITVVRGSKGGLRTEDAKGLDEKQRAKDEDRSVNDFYRFQMRERRKAEQEELLKKFGEDRTKVDAMRQKRLSSR